MKSYFDWMDEGPHECLVHDKRPGAHRTSPLGTFSLEQNMCAPSMTEGILLRPYQFRLS